MLSTISLRFAFAGLLFSSHGLLCLGMLQHNAQAPLLETAQAGQPAAANMPILPTEYKDFLAHVRRNPEKPMAELVEPYRAYEDHVRELMLQDQHIDNALMPEPVGVFSAGNFEALLIRARDIPNETEQQRNRFIMPLDAAFRRPPVSPAVVDSLDDFIKNFDIFSAGVLAGFDWTNVAAVGSAVAISLLPVPRDYALYEGARQHYYDKILAPFSVVDLVIYGLDEQEAFEKLEHIERCIQNPFLATGTKTIRTNSAITIISAYPTRHIRIKLRLYASIRDVLMDCDVDSSCVAYDGSQVLMSPRALGAYITQTNTVALNRWSSAYETQLARYFDLGFEVYWPEMDRDRIDPTIYSKGFKDNHGLARLLVLENSPTQLTVACAQKHLPYCSYNLPYGPRLVANHVYNWIVWGFEDADFRYFSDHPHRESACVGTVAEVFKAVMPPQHAGADADNPFSMPAEFLKGISAYERMDAIKWTAATYTTGANDFFEAVSEGNISQVREWLIRKPAVLDARDHTGRTPLYVATMASSLKTMQCLLDAGADPLAQNTNGETPLHVAAMLGLDDAIALLLGGQMFGGMSAPVIDQTVLTPREKEKVVRVWNAKILTNEASVTPLHLAIIGGHSTTVKLLIQNFNADPSIPVILPIVRLHRGSSLKAMEILPLYLAMSLPGSRAEAMIRLLISFGASPLQVDQNRISGLQYASATRLSLLSAMLGDDEWSGNALNHVSIGGFYTTDLKCHNALHAAIQSQDIGSLSLLLERGAGPDLVLDEFIASCALKDPTPSNNDGTDEVNHKAWFDKSAAHPLFVAIDKDRPDMALLLLEAGAAVNVLMSGTDAYVEHGSRKSSRFVGSVLDAVDFKLQILQNDDGKRIPWFPRFPTYDLEAGLEYLDKFPESSYSRYKIGRQFENARLTNERSEQEYTALEQFNLGTLARMESIAALTAAFHVLRDKVLLAGAISAKQMFPDVKKWPFEEKRRKNVDPRRENSPRPWLVRPTFRCLTSRMPGYISLFEAAWTGDVVTIENLLLKQDLPFKAAMLDEFKVSAFSVAVLRGHFDAAKAILSAAMTQYTSAPEGKTSYGVQHIEMERLLEPYEYEDDRPYPGEFDDDAEDVHKREDHKDEAVSGSASDPDADPAKRKLSSGISPILMLCADIRAIFQSQEADDIISQEGGDRSNQRSSWRFGTRDAEPTTLFQLAIAANDEHLLSFLLDLAEQYTNAMADMEGVPHHPFVFKAEDFKLALKLGRIELMTEIIRRTGAGLPWDALGREMSSKLSGHDLAKWQALMQSAKRMEWLALEDKEWMPSGNLVTLSDSPLLQAVRWGNAASVIWLLEGEADKAYETFVRIFKDDSRLATLAWYTGDVQTAVKKWLRVRSEVALHAAVLREDATDKTEIIRHLLKHLPDMLEVKATMLDSDGDLDGDFTPLELSVHNHDKEVVAVLVEAGADQKVRDKQGRNIVHQVSRFLDYRDVEDIRSILSVMEKDLIPILAKQKSSEGPGGMTPVAAGLFDLAKARTVNQTEVLSIFRIIMAFTGGVELDVIAGTGETVLHMAVKQGLDQVVKGAVELRPELLWIEDHNGFTPYEVAQEKFVKTVLVPPVDLEDTRDALSLDDWKQGYNDWVVHRDPRTFVSYKEWVVDHDPRLYFGRKDDDESPQQVAWKTLEVCKELVGKYGVEYGDKRRRISRAEAMRAKQWLAAEKGREEGWK